MSANVAISGVTYHCQYATTLPHTQPNPHLLMQQHLPITVVEEECSSEQFPLQHLNCTKSYSSSTSAYSHVFHFPCGFFLPCHYAIAYRKKKKPSSGKTYHTITSPYCTAYQNTLLTNPKITLHLSMLSDLVRDLLLLR